MIEQGGFSLDGEFLVIDEDAVLKNLEELQNELDLDEEYYNLMEPYYAAYLEALLDNDKKAM